MSSDNKIIEKIELYTKGKMSLEETELFEGELASDEQLQKMHHLSLIADELVIAQEALKLKQQMRKDLNKSKPDWSKYILITLFGLGAAFWLYHNSNSDENEISSKESVRRERLQISEKSKDVESTTPIINNKESNDIGHKKNMSSGVTVNSEIQDTVTTRVVDKEMQQTPYLQETLKESSSINNNSTSTIAKTAVDIDPCLTLQGNIKFAITPSCKGQETGELHIFPESVKGGTAPYTFILNERQTAIRFNNLSSGHYDLWIKDAKNCIVESTQKIFVPEKICTTPKAYLFNPDYDHAWSIPYERDKVPVQIVIVEKSGKVYYKSQVHNLEPSEWIGESNMGLSLGIGLYFFTIEYADGSTDEGTVTVTK